MKKRDRVLTASLNFKSKMNVKSFLFVVLCAICSQLSKAFRTGVFPIFESKMSKAIERAGGSSTALSGWCGGAEFYTPRSLLSPDQIVKMFEEIDKDVTSSFATINTLSNSYMPMDIKETKDSYKFFIDLPGIEKKDIDIKVKGNELTVTAKREGLKKDDESEKFFRLERKAGSYQRTITLPEDADRAAISAENKNGVLELSIKKLPESVEREIKIEVN